MEHPETNRARRQGRLSVGVGLFLTCLVLTTIIGLFGGLMISNYTHNNYVMYAEKAETAPVQRELQQAVPEPAQAGGESEAKAESNAADAKAGTMAAFAENNQFTKAQIVEMSAPSVVGIDTVTTVTTNNFWYGYGQSYEAPGSGSGVILTEEGYIATCAHVVEGAKSVKVTLNDDTSYDATIVGTDKKNDIAIIKIEAKNLTPAIVGDSTILTVGSEVIAIGNPLGELRGTATAGIISATNRTIEVEGQAMTRHRQRQGQRQPGRGIGLRHPREQRAGRDQRPAELRLREGSSLSGRGDPGRDAAEPGPHVVLLRGHPLRTGGEGGPRQRRREGGHPGGGSDPQAGGQADRLRG